MIPTIGSRTIVAGLFALTLAAVAAAGAELPDPPDLLRKSELGDGSL